jgi:hypothetical protein
MPEQVLSSLRKRLELGTGKAFTLGTLLFIFASGALFYMYVSQNYAYLVERNFRLLATWSKELRETYENNLQSIKFRLTEIQIEKGNRLTSRSVVSPATAKGPILQDFEDITFQPLYFEDGPSSKENTGNGTRPFEQNPIQEKLGKLPYVRIDQAPKDSQNLAPPSPLTFGLNLQTDTPTTPEEPAKENDSEAILTASFALDRLIKTIVTEPVFNDVLLVDPTGLIVYQRNPSSFRFFHLRNLLHNQRVESGWWTEVLKKSGVDSNKPIDDKNLNEAIQSIVPAHVQVTLGGTDYEIFMQAVVFPGPNDRNSGSVSNPTPWILCGLLPTSTFRDQYLSVPFTILLLFIFLLVSALLILPLLSLVLMSPRERLSRFSVGTLLVTNILGAGVGTFFVLDLSFYRQTTSFLNERLQTIAETTHEAFQLQLDRLVWQLNTFDRKIEELHDLKRLSNSNDSKAWLARVALPDPCVKDQAETSQLCFPDYSVAFWVDGEGMLRETWSPGQRPYVQGVHDLSHREYVSGLQDSRLPLHRRRIDNQWIEFYVQPLITLENSERSFVVSMPHGASREQTDTDQTWIAAIQTEELGLLKSAVVPPGSGLAVIDNHSGQVLFHSDAHRMLRENFLEETDGNPELAALIHARAAGGFEGTYWGTGHHFYAKPIDELPWTLVVFRSKEMFRTVNFEILVFSSCLFTLYILGLLLWLKVLSVVYRSDAHGQAVRWLWPRQSACQVYNRLSLFHVVVSILGIILMVWSDWQWGAAQHYAIFGLLLPLLGLWLTVRTLWKSAVTGVMQTEQSQAVPGISLNSPRLMGAYARLGMASFVLIGVLPAILFFKLAHDAEMRLFVQQQVWGLAQSLEQHSHAPWRQVGTGDSRQNFQYVTNKPSCLIAGCQMDAHTPNNSTSTTCMVSATSSGSHDLQYILQGLYVDLSFPVCLSFETSRQVSGSQIETSWLQTFHQVVRKSSLQNPMNRESWGFLHPNGQGTATLWFRKIEGNYQAIDLLLPQIPLNLSQKQQPRMLVFQTAAPLFPWSLGTLLIGTILFGGFLLTVSYGLLRYAIARIFPLPSFFLRSHDPMSHEPNEGHEPLQNLLILGPPGSGKSAFIQKLHHEWERFDLHTIRGKISWAEAALAHVAGKTGAVVVDHFEYQWGDAAQDREKRIFIEGLLSRDLKVCIMSACNPYDWEEKSFKDPLATSSLDPRGPWTDLFRTFGLGYFIPNTIEALIREWLNHQARDGHTEDRGHLLFVKRLLKQETEATMHLRKIGKWIRSFPQWPMWSPAEMKEQLRLAAFPYYRSLWESCSIHEKLALYHVASDGYLHAHNPELIPLCQKRLLHLNPDIQLLNESFRTFVLKNATKTRVAEWEAGANPDTWARLKYPFLLVFVAIVIFLFATQQEFKNSFITLVSLLPILLPALPELPLLFSSQKNTRSSSP